MKRQLLKWASKFMPKVSDTERIALESGGTSIDRFFFTGKMLSTPSLVEKYPFPTLKPESILIHQKVDDLCRQINDDEIFREKKIPDEVLSKIKNDGLLGMIITKKFGGLELGHHEQSQIVQKISTASTPVGIFVMVPNSLGPAELLLKYGTKDQKEYYLPKLATGEFLPCFGLTGVYSGSDAASMRDRGVVKRNPNDGSLYIELTVEKRYITLAPIANVVGLAFVLEDPDNLLPSKKSGITVALLSRDQLEMGNKHNPMDVPFPNGTIRAHHLPIQMSDIIGGEENIGNGWRMLMECLSVGRSISLPACAVGSAKLASIYTGTYSVYRKQFKRMIGDMEGVQEKLAVMASETLKITSIQYLTNSILDTHENSSVLSAIMKYETTERSRRVVTMGMDIVGGAGICKGSHNVLANVYQAIPIGITVEGSNTLTRSLIIFGNGLMKSHPYLYDLIQSLEKKEEDQFFGLMKKFVWLHLYNGVRTMTYQMGSPFYSSSLKHGKEKYNAQFAVYAGLILLLGKKFKTSECLSGRMADIMGSMYICTALEWYGHHHPFNQSLKELMVISQKEELIKVHQNFQDIANNFPILPIRLLMQFLNVDCFSWKIADGDRLLLANSISKNGDIRTLFMENIHLPPLLEEMCKEHEHVLKYHSNMNSPSSINSSSIHSSSIHSSSIHSSSIHNHSKNKLEELIHKAISVDEYP